MQFLLILGAVIVSLAIAVLSAQALLSLVFHFMSKLR
jgi:hypothetical protein